MVDSLSQIENRGSIAFISPNPGDGTTTAAIATAYSMGENLSEKVLLVDLNARHPSLHTIFDLPLSPGIGDILADSSISNEDIIHKKEENLSVITVGGEHIFFQKELILNKFQVLLNDLKEGFDYVLFDICPIGQLPLVNNLISLFDGVILIIACENTTWEAAQHFKGRLESAGANLLGAILNKRRYYIPKWLYGSL